MLSETPREIESVLVAATALPDGGESVRAERRLLDDRLSMLTKKAVQEMRSLGRSKDFQAVTRAMMTYEDFPEETRTYWDALRKHWDELVRTAKKRLRSLSSVSDPLLLARELETYTAYGEAASGEIGAVRDRYEALLKQARQEMQMLCVRSETTITDFQAAIGKYESYPDDVAVARDQMRIKMNDLIAGASSSLAALSSSDNVAELDAAVAQYSGTGEALQAPLADVSRRRQELSNKMREELKKALTGDDPNELSQLLARAESYGVDLARWCSAVEDRRVSVLHGARDALAAAGRSSNYEHCMSVLEKYRSFSDDTATLHAELDAHVEQLLDAAQDGLRELVSATNPKHIQNVIAEYSGFGDAVANEVGAAKDRLAVVLREARAEMEMVSTKDDASILEMEKVLLQYADYPVDVDIAKEALQARMAKGIRAATDELVALRQTEDVQKIEVELLKWQQKGGAKLSVPLNDLRDHRKMLYERTREHLRKAMDLDSPAEIDQVLGLAKQFNADELGTELRALERRRIASAKAVVKDFHRLKRSRNFAEVSAALQQYEGEGSCPEELVGDYKALQQWWESLRASAKEALTNAASATHPSEIDQLLDEYEMYGQSLSSEISAVKDQREKLIAEANTALLNVANNPGATFKELDDALQKFSSYPVPDIRKARDQAKTKLAVMATRARERLNAAALTKDIEDIQALLTEFAEPGELIRNAYDGLQSHFGSLKDVMRRKLANAVAQTDPSQITEVLEEAESFGPTVERETAFLKDRLASLSASAIEDMARLHDTVDYRIVSDAIKKYEGYPDDTTESWEALQRQLEKLVEEAKDAVLQLCTAETPMEIDEAMKQYDVYSDSIQEARDTVQQRRAELISMATTDLQGALSDGVVDIGSFTELLNRYSLYPADVEAARGAVRSRLATAVGTVEEQIKAALATSDVEQVDSCLKKYGDFVEVAPLLKRLGEHRQYLQDSLFDRLKAAVRLTKPAEIQAAVDAAQPFLTDGPTAELVDRVCGHLDELQKAALEKLRSVLEQTDPDVLQAAVKEFSPFDDSAEVKPVLTEVRQKLDEMHQSVRDDIRVAILEGDPRKIDKMLHEAQKYKQSLQIEIPALQRKLDAVVAKVDKEFRDLMRTSDVVAMGAALAKYSNYPAQFDKLRTTLQDHMETAVDAAKSKMLMLCASTDPRAIAMELDRYSHYGEDLEAETAAAKERLAELIDFASKDMVSASQADGAKVSDMEALLLKYSEYPDSIQEAREALLARIRTETATVRDQLRTLMVSEDIIEVEKGLQQFASAGKQFADLLADLRDHKLQLLTSARDKMKDALLWTAPKDIEDLLHQTQIFGKEVLAERKALERRRTAVIREAIRDMQALAHSNEYAVVTEAIARYTDFSPETKAYLSQLEKHSVSLLQKIKTQLKESCSALHPKQITQVLGMIGAEYEELVQEDVESAKTHLQQLIEEARGKLESTAASDDVGLKEMEEILQQYSDFPADIRQARDALRTKFIIRSTKAIDALNAGLKLQDVAAVNELIEAHKVGSTRIADALGSLKAHRASLSQVMGDQLKDALGQDNPVMMEELLKQAEPFGQELHASKKAVERRKASVIRTINKELLLLQQSSDFLAIESMLKRTEPLCESESLKAEIDEHLQPLQNHRKTLVDSAKQALQELASATDPIEIDKCMVLYASYGDEVESELDACRNNRLEIVSTAKAEMEGLINASEGDSSLQAMSEKLTQYAAFPDDVQRVRQKLQRKYTANAREMGRKIRAGIASRNPNEVDELLEQFESVKDHASDAFAELQRHRKRLQDNMAEQLHAELSSRDLGRVDAVLTRAELFGDALQKERDTLAAHSKSLVEEVQTEIQDLCKETDCRVIETGLKRFHGLGDTLSDAYSQLRARHEEIIEGCRTELSQLLDSVDPAQISDGLKTWESCASATQDVRDDVRRRWVELVDVAREEVTTVLHDSAATVQMMDEVIKKYETYPAEVSRIVDLVRAKVSKMLESGTKECNQGAISNDFQLITALIEKYDSAGEFMVYEVEALKAQQTSLQEIMATRLARGKDLSDPRQINSLLTDAQPFQDIGEMAEPLTGLRDHLEGLQNDVRQKLHTAAESVEIEEVVRTMEEADPFKDDMQLVEAFRNAQNNLKRLQAMMRGRLRDAQSLNSPAEIDAIIDSATVFGDAVSTDLRLLQAKRSSLVQMAVIEVKRIVKTNDFPSMKAALEQYESFPHEHKAVWDMLQDRVDELVEEANDKLRDLRTATDPSVIELVVSRFDTYGELVEEQRKAAFERRDALQEAARLEMRQAEGTISDMQKVLDKYAKYAGVDDDRRQLKERVDAVVTTKHEILKEALGTRDIAKINEALLLRQECGAHLESSFTRLEKQQRSMLDLMRNKMKVALSSHNTSAIVELLVESEPYGDSLTRWRRALAQRKEMTVQTVVNELQVLCESQDPASVTVAIQKYEKYSAQFEEAKPVFEALQKRRESLIETARARLKELCCQGTDITEMQAELPRYDAFGSALDDERKAVHDRVASLSQDAREQLGAALESEERIGELDRLLRKYSGFSSQVELLRKRLKEKLDNSLRIASQKLKRVVKLTDVAAIDSILAEYEDTGEHLASMKEMARRHRQQLHNSMFFQLRNALVLDSIKDIDMLLEKSNAFGDTVQHEREELQRRRAQVVESVIDQIKSVMGSEDIVSINAAISKYGSYAEVSDDVRTQHQQLQEHCAALVKEAKQDLHALVEAEDPNLISTGMAKYDLFGDTVEPEREMTKNRLVQVLDRGRAEIEDLLGEENATIADMSTTLDKFAAYGDSLSAVLERLRAKLDASIRAAAEALENAAQSRNVAEIDQILRTYTEASSGVLATMRSAAQKHRDTLVNDMHQRVAACLDNTDDPSVLAEILSDIVSFGEELTVERSKVDERLQTVVSDIVNHLRKLAGSDDFEAVSAALVKYEGLDPEVSQAWSMQLITLQQRRDELIDDAKAELRKMKRLTEPSAVAEGLTQYKEFGSTVVLEKDALRDRIRALVDDAVIDIQRCLKSNDVHISAVDNVLQKYCKYPEGVQESLQALAARKETMIITADKSIRKVLGTKDILLINELLSQYDSDCHFVEDAYGALTLCRLDLEDDMRERLKAATNASVDQKPQETEALLMEAQPFGVSIREEREALEVWLAALLDKLVAELHDLTRSQQPEVVNAAVTKYAGYPPPVEGPWQKLVLHRNTLLDTAKVQLVALCDARTPMEITDALPQYLSYGDDLADARNAVLVSYSNLIDAARSDIDMWFDRPDATIGGMSEVIAKYANYPAEVSRARVRLEKKRNSAIRVAEKKINAALSCPSAVEVETLMIEYEPARQHLANSLQKLEVRREALVREVADRLHLAAQGEDSPMAIHQIILECEPLGNLVRFDLEMAKERYNNIVQAAVDDILSLVGSDDFQSIDTALHKYSSFPDEVLVHSEKLLQHRNLLVQTARAHLQDVAASSTDHSLIVSVLEKYEDYGELLSSERRDLEVQLAKLTDEANAEIMQIVSFKASSLPQLQAIMDKYTGYAGAIDSAMSQLHQRIESLRSLKNRLRDVVKTCHAHDITAELERYQEYGEAISEERALLRARYDELIATARTELKQLIDMSITRDEGASDSQANSNLQFDIQAVETCLEKYRKTTQVADLHAALQMKHKKYVQSFQSDLHRLLSCTDISAIDSVLARCRQSGHALAAPLVALQRHRMQLCDLMSEKMQHALLSSDPTDIGNTLRSAQAYGVDLQNERRLLTEHLDTLLHAAEVDIAKALQLDNVREIERVLQKYENYPESIRHGVLRDLQTHKEELRRGFISRVELAMNCEDIYTIDDLLKTLRESYREGMDPYREMLDARRDKLRDVMVFRMREAMQSDNLVQIDRVFRNSMPLVEQIDEQLWSRLRQHRDDVVKRLRDRVREALSETSNLDAVDNLLESVRTCQNEMLEEWAELQEHRAYLLDEAKIVARESAETLNAATVAQMGFAAVTSKLAHLKHFGEHVGDELSRLQQLQSDLIETARSQLQDLLAIPSESADAKAIMSALEKYQEYGKPLQRELRALSLMHSRIGEQSQRQLAAIVATKDVNDMLAPRDIGKTLDQAQHYVGLASEVKRVRELQGQMVSTAQHKMQAVLDNPMSPLEEVQEVMQKYRDYSDETVDLWGQVHARYVEVLSSARVEILQAMSSDDLHHVHVTLRKYAMATSAHSTGAADNKIETNAALASGNRQFPMQQTQQRVTELESVKDVAKDIQTLQAHYRRLLKQEQRDLLDLLHSDDLVVLHERLAWHSEHGHSLLVREVHALRRRLRKLEKALQAKLQAMIRGVNVIEMERLLRQYASLRASEHCGLAPELHALQKRRDTLLRRSRVVGHESDASGQGLDTPSATGSPVVSSIDEAVVSAKQDLTQMLHSQDLAAIDAALEKYSYLGPAVDVLTHKLRTRQTLVACAPRGQQYSSLVDNAKRTAELELSSRSLRERLGEEEQLASSAEARLSAERAAMQRVEDEIRQLRRQVRQRARIAQLNADGSGGGGVATASRSSPAHGRRGNARTKGCVVCKARVPVAEWRAHCLQCVDKVVRFSIVKAG